MKGPKGLKMTPIKMLSSLAGCLKNTQICLTIIANTNNSQLQLHLQIANTHISYYDWGKANRKYLFSVHIWIDHLKQIYPLSVLDARSLKSVSLARVKFLAGLIPFTAHYLVLFCKWKFLPLSPLHLFHPYTHPFPL